MSDLSKTRVGQVQLDRLVDGEFDPQDRREAISQLAQQPDGWRRCAWHSWRLSPYVKTYRCGRSR